MYNETISLSYVIMFDDFAESFYYLYYFFTILTILFYYLDKNYKKSSYIHLINKRDYPYDI